MTTTFGFKNDTKDTAHQISTDLLGLVTNYAVTSNTADECALNNKTCAIDRPEFISFQTRQINKVNTPCPVRFPANTTSLKPIQYSVQVAETLTTEDPDTNFRVDEPIVMTLSIRHNISGEITNDTISEVLVRLLSSLRRADGSWRFDDLMRSAEKPVVD